MLIIEVVITYAAQFIVVSLIVITPTPFRNHFPLPDPAILAGQGCLPCKLALANPL